MAQTNWTQSSRAVRTAPTSRASGPAATRHRHQLGTTAKDFGNWTTGTVSGTKFEDLDADGAATDSGEPARPTGRSAPTAADGAWSTSDLTAADGSYELT